MYGISRLLKTTITGDTQIQITGLPLCELGKIVLMTGLEAHGMREERTRAEGGWWGGGKGGGVSHSLSLPLSHSLALFCGVQAVAAAPVRAALCASLNDME